MSFLADLVDRSVNELTNPNSSFSSLAPKARPVGATPGTASEYWSSSFAMNSYIPNFSGEVANRDTGSGFFGSIMRGINQSIVAPGVAEGTRRANLYRDIFGVTPTGTVDSASPANTASQWQSLQIDVATAQDQLTTQRNQRLRTQQRMTTFGQPLFAGPGMSDRVVASSSPNPYSDTTFGGFF